MSKFPMAIVAAVIALVMGCNASGGKSATPDSGNVVGTWKWDKHPTEWGPAVAFLTFTDLGTLEVRIVFTGEDEIEPEDEPKSPGIVLKGAFEIRDGELTSEVMYKGKPVAIWIAKGCLYFSFEHEVSGPFRRVR